MGYGLDTPDLKNTGGRGSVLCSHAVLQGVLSSCGF